MVNEFIGKYLSISRRAHAALLDKKLAPYNISHGQILKLFTNANIYYLLKCILSHKKSNNFLLLVHTKNKSKIKTNI